MTNNKLEKRTFLGNSVLLTDQFAKSLFKQAILTGHISIVKPNTNYESEMIKVMKNNINRARSDKGALYYALLFDEIYLDEASWGSSVIFNADIGPFNKFSELSELDKNISQLSSRSAVNYVSPEFSKFCRIIFTMNPAAHPSILLSNKEEANFISMLEPLVWQSFLRSHSGHITREILRDILDILILKPYLISELRNEDIEAISAKEFNDEEIDGKYELDINKWSGFFEELGFKYSLNGPLIRYFNAVLAMTLTKGDVAIHKVMTSLELQSVFPIPKISFGKNRNTKDIGRLKLVKNEELIISVKLFLDEVKFIPHINNLNDVFRLKEHKYFQEFRGFLTNWVEAIYTGDKSMEAALRREIASANNSLKKIIKCNEIGRFFVYLGIPFLFLDALFGSGLTIAGFGIQGVSDWLKRKNRWLLIGKD